MYYRSEELITFATGVGQALGMERIEAQNFSQSLVYADM